MTNARITNSSMQVYTSNWMSVYYYFENTTNLRLFTLLYAILLPFAPLCAPLRYFSLLYSTLLGSDDLLKSPESPLKSPKSPPKSPLNLLKSGFMVYIIHNLLV